MAAKQLNSQKLEQLLKEATSPRERKMYQSLLKKALIEEQKAQAKRQIQEKAQAEAIALKAQISSSTQDKQETVNLKESTTTTMSHPKKIINAEKTKHFREYTVKEHQRKIYEREYKFVCSGCDRSHSRKN